MRRVEPDRPRPRRTGLSAAAKARKPAYPLGPRFAGPRQGPGEGWLRPPSIPRTPALRRSSWAGGSPPVPLAGAS